MCLDFITDILDLFMSCECYYLGSVGFLFVKSLSKHDFT